MELLYQTSCIWEANGKQVAMPAGQEVAVGDRVVCKVLRRIGVLDLGKLFCK